MAKRTSPAAEQAEAPAPIEYYTGVVYIVDGVTVDPEGEEVTLSPEDEAKAFGREYVPESPDPAASQS